MTIKELKEVLSQFEDNKEVVIIDNWYDKPIEDVYEYDEVIFINAKSTERKRGNLK